jgi:hypothetical protein
MSFASGGFAPDDRGSPADRDERRPAAELDPALLERVLEETLSDAAASHLDPAEMRALADVARRYPGASLVADPIAAELVKSILKVRFRGSDASDTFWQEVSRQIANTLCEAPDTRERLDCLWSQLSELAT